MSKFRNFGIKIRESTFAEDDISKNCVNYPHEKYESFKDCDDDFIATKVPPGLVPIWLNNNTDNVTTSHHLKGNFSAKRPKRW